MECKTITVGEKGFFTFSTVNSSDLNKCTSGWCAEDQYLAFNTPSDRVYTRIEGELRVKNGFDKAGAAIKIYDAEAGEWIMVGSQQVKPGNWYGFDYSISKRKLLIFTLDTLRDNTGLDFRGGKLHFQT